MALTTIERIRWLIGDRPPNRFYPLITDEEIEDALELFSNDIMRTSVACARSIAMVLSQKNTKEVYGDVEVWSEDRKQYLEALKLFISDPSTAIPTSFMPYAAGISCSDLETSAADTDNPRTTNFLYTNTTECSDGLNLKFTL
jgi:hypothetical protein